MSDYMRGCHVRYIGNVISDCTKDCHRDPSYRSMRVIRLIAAIIDYLVKRSVRIPRKKSFPVRRNIRIIDEIWGCEAIWAMTVSHEGWGRV